MSTVKMNTGMDGTPTRITIDYLTYPLLSSEVSAIDFTLRTSRIIAEMVTSAL